MISMSRFFSVALPAAILSVQLLYAAPAYAQSGRSRELVAHGKEEHRTYLAMVYGDEGSYDSAEALSHLNNAREYLEEAVAIDPEYQEAHYFLAHVYDRIWSGPFPGEQVPYITLERTRIISNHLEKMLAISPRYDGEVLIQGPRAKLTAVWGSLAAAYAVRGLPDSARWALQEGKRAGAFQRWNVEMCRNILRTCDRNAILLVNGDGDTFPMYYLQGVERYRNDVTVLHLGLLNTPWYARWMKSTKGFGAPLRELGYSEREIDSLAHEPMEYSREYRIPLPKKAMQTFRITDPEKRGVKDGEVKLMVQGMDGAFRIQDKIVLDILVRNEWRRPVYFSTTVDWSEIAAMGLSNHIKTAGGAMQVYPAPFLDDEARIDVQRLEQLMFADGKQGFSWAGWDELPQYDRDGQQNASIYFLVASMLIEHYVRTEAGPKPVEKVMGRLESIFARERFPDIYRFSDTMMEPESDGTAGDE